MGLIHSTGVSLLIFFSFAAANIIGLVHSLQRIEIPTVYTTVSKGLATQPATTAINTATPGLSEGSSFWIPLASIKGSEFFERDGDVYFGSSPKYPGIILDDADPTSFLVLENPDGTATVIGKDNKHVFWESTIIAGADPTTFTPVNAFQGVWSLFERDKNHVYFGSSEIANADPATFVVLGTVWLGDEYEVGVYAKDRYRVYFSDQAGDIPIVVTDADSSTFHLDFPVTDVGGAFFEGSCGGNCLYDASDNANRFYLGGTVK